MSTIPLVQSYDARILQIRQTLVLESNSAGILQYEALRIRQYAKNSLAAIGLVTNGGFCAAVDIALLGL